MRVFNRITSEAAYFLKHGNPFWRNTKTEKHRGGQQKAWNQSQIDKSQAGLTAAGGYGASAAGVNPAAQFQAIADNPMSATEKSGVLSAAGGPFDALGQKAGERQAATRNSAGYGELLDQLARQKSQAMGTTASSLESEAFKRKMAALGGLGGLYGTNVGAQTNLLRPGSPNFQPGFWQNFLMNAMQGGATVGAAALSGGKGNN
jgi:hypothetical protein